MTKLYLFCKSTTSSVITSDKLQFPQYKTLPYYTILTPLYKEVDVLEQLVSSMNNMVYPKEKLQILIVLEEDDLETINKARSLNLHNSFELVIVPESQLKTKAKACNYAMKWVKGEFVAIYDAEDKPDPMQLIHVAAVFAKSGNQNLGCVQCKLHYYNASQNLLTKMFQIEYKWLFGWILPSLQKLEWFIPLGGSSNHIKASALKNCGYWDQYNVTEDAELGLKMSELGYKTVILNSWTHEDAPDTPLKWMKQRARWIKGHALTYARYIIKHTNCKLKRISGVHSFFGMSAIMMIFSPFTSFYTLLFFTTQQASQNGYNAALLTSFIALTLHLITSAFYGAKVGGYSNLMIYPLYHILHFLASFIALWQIFTAPTKWDKTMHKPDCVFVAHHNTNNNII